MYWALLFLEKEHYIKSCKNKQLTNATISCIIPT